MKAKVDRALGTLSRTTFNPDTYHSILEAMSLMHGGKTMKILESHTTHFKSSVESATKRAIITTLLSDSDNEMFSPEELERLKIVTLCRRLNERHFPMCLNLMFEQFCNYLFTYHAITVWLNDEIPNQKEEKNVRIFTELRDGLLKHKRVLWEQQMQENVTLMLGALKITEIQVATFLAILASLSKFIAIAEEFGGTKAHTLRETFKEHAKVFFAQFHRTRLEQLKDLLEKDSWTACTDLNKKGLGIKDFAGLQEIVVSTMPQQRAYKRRKQSFFENSSVQANPFAAETDGLDIDEISDMRSKKKHIARYKWEEGAIGPELLVDVVDELGNVSSNANASNRKTTSPMSPNLRTGISRTGAGANSGNSNRNSSAHHQSNASGINPVVSGAPLISNTVRTVVEFVGEYMHLMQLLPGNMTHLVFDGLVQIVEYFLFTVYSFFAISKPVMTNGDRNMTISLRRIQSDLILDNVTYEALVAANLAALALAAKEGSITAGIRDTTSSMFSGIRETFSLSKGTETTNATGASNSTQQVPLPSGVLSQGGVFYKTEPGSSPTQVKMVRAQMPKWIGSGNLQQQVQAALVAGGSVRFLRQILVDLQPNFIELLGRERLSKVISFTGTLAETTVPLRAAIFRYASQNVIGLEKQIAAVGQGAWDSLDDDVRESAYVKPLIKDVGNGYIEKLKTMVKQNLVPVEILPELVAGCLSLVMEICVEGYSKARRVTPEGHNIMLYDSQEIKSGLEKVAGIRNHDFTFLDEYVHAYHFPTDDLLNFFKEHPQYTKSQLQGLVISGPWNQKEKTRLLDALNYHGAVTASASNSRATSSTRSATSSQRR